MTAGCHLNFIVLLIAGSDPQTPQPMQPQERVEPPVDVLSPIDQPGDIHVTSEEASETDLDEPSWATPTNTSGSSREGGDDSDSSHHTAGSVPPNMQPHEDNIKLDHPDDINKSTSLPPTVWDVAIFLHGLRVKHNVSHAAIDAIYNFFVIKKCASIHEAANEFPRQSATLRRRLR